MGHHPLFQASALVTAPDRARIDTHDSAGPGRVPSAIQAAPLLAQRQAERDLPAPTQPFAGLSANPSDEDGELLQPTWQDYAWLFGCFGLGAYALYLVGRLLVLIAERLLEGL